MKEQNLDLVKQSFKEFYFKHADYVETPSRIEEREFGYMQFNGGMIRHLSFKDKEELRAELLKHIPSDVYSSCAYYVNPTAPMQEKIFKGADLIFDIDADELGLTCLKQHEAWICNDCRNVMGTKQNCNRCNSMKIEKTSLACDNCIDAGKEETKKLIKLLQEDLGISENEIKIYFSGNHGFHLHIYNKEFELLDSPSRMDIANYVIGNNILPESFGVRKNAQSSEDVTSKFPNMDDFGWRGRICRKLMKKDQAKSRVVRKILKNGYLQFKTEINDIAREIGAHIDPKVTMDIHRVFRMHGTLNGKSGLTKAPCSDIDSFDPFTSACMLADDEVSVRVRYSPKFSLNENFFGPFKDQEAKLPRYAAVYLICKGLADVSL
ncbi:MAG: DNA primase small subunit domain-containing protein [Nitrososphaerales archaeon]